MISAMDPITGMSAVAAAAGLADVGLKIARFLVELSRTIKDLPSSVRGQIEPIEQLVALARLILVNPGLQTDSVAEVLRTCFSIAGTLEKTLQSIGTNKEGKMLKRVVKRVWKSLVAVAGKINEIEKLSVQLERQKSTLIICIQEHDS